MALLQKERDSFFLRFFVVALPCQRVDFHENDLSNMPWSAVGFIYIMARLINRKRDKTLPDKPGTQRLFVRGVRYFNTAAKFWPSLIDEVQEDFPNCTMIELAASTSTDLEPEQLFPEIALERDFHYLLTVDMREAMRNILAQLEIMGPPCAVQIRLLCGEEELLSSALPLDCIDAEIFPFLIVWLLEWAGIPEFQWNNEFLRGEITAEDRKRHRVYQISFSLKNSHLSEGLYRRSISLVHSVDAYSGMANTAAP